MNSILDRYIGGKFEYETGSLDFSCSKIELDVNKNELTEGSFTIRCVGGKRAEGYVLSTHSRMVCELKALSGTDIKVPYVFDSANMEEGETLRGEFHIISNCGEYYIPYIVTVIHETMESSMGSIKNLFHFANLAKTDWEEAVKLFYRKEFAKILNGSDKQYFDIYQGLSGVCGNEQNVDEFLIQINKKSKTEYIPMESLIRIDAPNGMSEGKATITRNGWGYTRLTVETDGDFLSVEKDVLTDNDFLGNICSFSYCIDATKLHAGNNYGKILIYNAHFSTAIEFIVVNGNVRSLFRGNKRKMQELSIQLTELFCKFRVKKISHAIWLKETGEIVERMNELDEKSIPARLFKVQLLITQDRLNEAKWMLDMLDSDIGADRSNPEIWCYYLYLTTLYNREEGYVNEITEEVESIYLRNPGNWRIAWLLLYLREEFSKSPYKKWAFLERQFIEECKSPAVYIEAVILMNQTPTLLNKLEEFEIQILNYAAKHQLLTKDVIIQVQFLMAKVKEYSHRLYVILKKCYEISESDEILSCICSLLIRGNKTGSEYFSWYQKAVAKELRITRLYEFYMMSLPNDYGRELPKMVMMYFAYHSELDYVRKAVLYANILKHKDEFPDIAESYRDIIDVFVADQIKKGHINRDLAYLYQNVMNPVLLRSDYLENLVPLLFTNLIQVTDSYIKSVVLIYSRLKEETVYPLDADGSVCIPIYSNDYQLIFQDGKGNRYCNGVQYSIEKLMIPGKYLKEMGELTPVLQGLDLYNCSGQKMGISITDKNVDSYCRLYKSPQVRDDYRREAGIKLAQYYQENDKLAELDAMLFEIVPEGMSAKERAVYVQLMIARGMLEKAYEWVEMYGVAQIEGQTLLKLCSRILVRKEFEQDESLVRVAYHTFRSGKYDENIIKYLVSFYEGLTRDMRDIWKAAQNYKVDTHDICEKMILQMLFCGSFVGQKEAIFDEYVASGGRLVVEMAYLTQNAYEYVVKDRIVSGKVFEYLTKLFYRGEQFHAVCKYAYIKYFAENTEQITESVGNLLTQFVDECMNRKIYFGFFQNLMGYVPRVAELSDKTVIEYHANPKAKVCIHYILERKEGDNAEYCKEEMHDMYEGCFVKPFTLFFGEKLQYYITEEIDGNEGLTESATICKSDITQESGHSKFFKINDMMIALTLQEYQTVDKMAYEYFKQEYAVDKIFKLL